MTLEQIYLQDKCITNTVDFIGSALGKQVTLETVATTRTILKVGGVTIGPEKFTLIAFDASDESARLLVSLACMKDLLHWLHRVTIKFLGMIPVMDSISKKSNLCRLSIAFKSEVWNSKQLEVCYIGYKDRVLVNTNDTILECSWENVDSYPVMNEVSYLGFQTLKKFNSSEFLCYLNGCRNLVDDLLI